MTTPPSLIVRAWFTLLSDPLVKSFGVPVELLGSPMRRVGLDGAGDLVITMKRADYEALDLSVGLPIDGDVRARVSFGLDGDDPVELGGYFVREVAFDGYGLNQDDVGDPDPEAARDWNLVRMALSPETARWRDGRGGYLWDGTRNATLPDGTPPDADDPDRLENSDLVALLAGAILKPIETPLPGTLDEAEPPAPLDWGACRAIPELESLLSRIGHIAVLRNSGSAIRIVRLARAGEPIAVPEGFAEHAEPYRLSDATSLRATTMVVTSARTRSTIITARDATELEWVWFDQRLGVWLNGPDTATLYPGETRPDDIAAFRAGPGADGRPPEEFGRLFRALRVPDGHTPRIGRLVTVAESFVLPIPGGDDETIEMGGTPAVGYGMFAEPVGSAQFVARSDTAIPGVRTDALNRVFVLPFPLVSIPAGQGSLAVTDEIAEGDVRLFFAHEADEEASYSATNYYIRVFDAEVEDGELLVEQRVDPDIEFVLRAQETVVVEAPFLRRVGTDLVAFPDITWLNDSTLDPVALTIARARAGAGVARSGVVVLRGFHAVEPGDWGGAVSQVQWLLGAASTIVTLGLHEVPESDIDAAEAAAGRSFVAGLSRFTGPGSSAALSDGRGGSSPATPNVASAAAGGGSGGGGGGGSGGGGGDPATMGGGRGAERSLGTPGLFVSPAPVAHAHGYHDFFAEITGSTVLSANRWLYQWREASLTAVHGFVGSDAGRSSALGDAVNLAEAHNDGSGVEGNGVDLEDLPETFTMRPIPVGSVVLIRGPYRATTGVAQWVFDRVNAIDGPCPEPEGDPE